MSKKKLKPLIEQEIKNIIQEIHKDDFQRGKNASTDHCTDCNSEEHEGDTGEIKGFSFGVKSGLEKPENSEVCYNCYDKRRKKDLMNTFSKNEMIDDEEDQFTSGEEEEGDFGEEPSDETDMEQEPVDGEEDEEPAAMDSDPTDLQNMDGTGDSSGQGLKADLMYLSDMTKQAADSMPDGEDGSEPEPWVGTHMNAAKELLAHVADYFQDQAGEDGMSNAQEPMEDPTAEPVEEPEDSDIEQEPTGFGGDDDEGEGEEEEELDEKRLAAGLRKWMDKKKASKAGKNGLNEKCSSSTPKMKKKVAKKVTSKFKKKLKENTFGKNPASNYRNVREETGEQWSARVSAERDARNKPTEPRKPIYNREPWMDDMHARDEKKNVRNLEKKALEARRIERRLASGGNVQLTPEEQQLLRDYRAGKYASVDKFHKGFNEVDDSTPSEKLRKKSDAVDKMANIQKSFEDETGSTGGILTERQKQLRTIREIISKAQDKNKAIRMMEAWYSKKTASKKKVDENDSGKTRIPSWSEREAEDKDRADKINTYGNTHGNKFGENVNERVVGRKSAPNPAFKKVRVFIRKAEEQNIYRDDEKNLGELESLVHSLWSKDFDFSENSFTPEEKEYFDHAFPKLMNKMFSKNNLQWGDKNKPGIHLAPGERYKNPIQPDKQYQWNESIKKSKKKSKKK